MESAVLFADVAGSTALYEVLGDDRALALVEACLQAMVACTAGGGGRVVKTIGDAVLAVFGSADAAAAAAAEMQARVQALGAPAGVHLALRIGFHLGPVVERDGDVFGDTVNLASRLCDLAYKGQIVTDQGTAQRLSALHAANLRPLFSVPVKGKAQEIELVALMWQSGNDERTAIMLKPASASAPRARLELDLGGTHVEMGPQRRKVSIGRNPECDFAVPGHMVSRAHATIERRREHFVLADHSSNGTYVTFAGQPELKVQHEELTLLGHGWIAFGQTRSEARQVAEFRCVDA
jgi:class 3 adenylate cyclase